ncbi:MAG: ribonuclease P protein component [Ruminococcus sp.]|nr:ribonuclease P protein component [Candidatus Copronaster equi]
MHNIQVIKQNSDFRRAYGRGKSFSDPALVTYVLKNNNRAGICRVGITTSKKIGCAVERNRCRRIIRAALREVEPQLKEGYDLVFVARSKTKQLKSTEIYNIMYHHLSKAGVVKE